MRLFFAVEILPEAQKRIYESLSPLRKQWPKIRWIPSENLHITLKFLGEVEENRVAEVKSCAERCIAEIKPGTLKISFAGLGAFPKPKYPRVIWCGVNGQSEILSSIAAGLESGLEGLGFEREKRPYRAHLTVGKVSPEKKAVDLEKYIQEYEKTIFAGISVNMISLMQSVLNPHGAVYERIHQIYL